MAAETMRTLGEDSRPLELKRPVGFDTLPDQFVNREIQRGFTFNLMVLGATGMGKSTLLESLFRQEFDEPEHSHNDEGVSVDSFVVNLEEGGVHLKLRVVSSVGLGDQLDRRKSADALIEHIDSQFEAYLQEELRIRRNLAAVDDSRIHACIYLLEPTGRHLKSLDMIVMKALCQKVNLIPVIAKADVLTRQEVVEFKHLIKQELQDNNIEIYRPEPEDELEFEALMPMAVIGSRSHVTINGEHVRVRQYPWGIVEVENEAHSDFVRLREMLLRSHMERLRRRTNQVHYETFRRRRLEEMGLAGESDSGDAENVSIRDTYEKKRQEIEDLMEQRENEMRAGFVKKVKAKEAEIRSREQALESRKKAIQSEYAQRKAALERELEELLNQKKRWTESVEREREREQERLAEPAHGKKREKTKKKHKQHE